MGATQTLTTTYEGHTTAIGHFTFLAVWEYATMKFRLLSSAALAALLAAGTAGADVTVLSDSFSRNPAGTIVGTAPLKDTTIPNPPGWVSSWGANNNAAGGYVSQTYTTYVDGTRFSKVDGTNGISGNWLNNGSTAHPLKYNQSTTTTTEPIGIPGFAWVQLNHDFDADALVTGSGKMTVSFDLYRSAGGNMSWYFGNSQVNGQNNGNAGSPALNTANDISLYWRGGTTNTFGIRDNGINPGGVAALDAINYATGTNFASSIPASIKIDITGTNFSTGATSVIDLFVNGIQQDLNGATAGSSHTLTWDAGGAAYMGFGSNSTPVEGTNAVPVYRAAGIDNLVITAIPEPTAFLFGGLVTSLVGVVMLRRRK